MSRVVSPPAPALTEWTSQLRRGVLELCLLQVLCDEPSYGYAIVTRLGALGSLASGGNTIYPLLRRLKAEGLLETVLRDSPTGPPRQYYRVTLGGRRRLTALTEEWTAMANSVAACLGSDRTGAIEQTVGATGADRKGPRA